ncbi:GTPase ObgE [Alkalibaculum sp. M08DMB]|uniref:GTPase Obg n=1 Tax=Alkalibaculum sporogenes TaxID=2655001 RepID=A0A6A7K8W8_9FIRM|nr:GTPase ObgE [Alkalibaculum sporogenes]MPW25918.1 GTPase ObgE [Alkalibaculum sporogenes]
MFVDRIQIDVKAGNGGHGSVAFRREKYVPNGGPAGGDGGKGGDVIIRVNPSLRTLIDFRYKKKHNAQPGGNGEGSNRSGSAGDDLIIGVPPGTIIKNKMNDNIIADLTEIGEEIIIAKGGKGGRGNQHFATSTRQAPRFAEGGEKGDELSLVLELKLLADVGLLGFPNVGKSTFLSVISKAKPKIADYPFTTLVPNLGVVKWKDYASFVVADIPGLIEGANEGAGLGHQFLRHVERTKLLVHILDISGFDGRDPFDDFTKINIELEKHNKKLSKRTQVVALNKADVIENISDLDDLIQKLNDKGFEVFIISAATGEGTDKLLDRIVMLLKEIGEVEPIFDMPEESEKIYRPTFKKEYTVRKENDYFIIEGDLVDKLLNSVNFEDYDSVAYFQRVLRNKGVISDLEDLGIEDGKVVKLSYIEFEYFK